MRLMVRAVIHFGQVQSGQYRHTVGILAINGRDDVCEGGVVWDASQAASALCRCNGQLSFACFLMAEMGADDRR